MNYSNAELASAWLGMLSPLWAALTALPLYWLGGHVCDGQAARRAVIWWPLVPATVMFAPNPSTVYPLLAVSALAMLVRGLRHDQMGWAGASGFMTSVMTFMNFSLLPIIALLGLVILFHSAFGQDKPRFDWQQAAKIGLSCTVGLASVWLLCYLAVGLTPGMVLSTAMSQHLSLDRPYLPWLILSLNDFFMFTGWPLVFLAGASVWQLARTAMFRKSLAAAAALALGLFLTLLAVDASGTVQGESGRILLYLSPSVLLVASVALQVDEGDQTSLIFTIAQAVMLLVMVGFVHVIDSGLSRPPAAPPDLPQPSDMTYLPGGAVFDEMLRLESFAGRIDEQEHSEPVLTLWLEWQSLGQVDIPYYVSFIPVGPDGQAAPQATLVQPFDSKYPTTCWLPSSGSIRDRYEIPLPVFVPGDWWVSLSLVDGHTGQIAPVLLPDGSQDTQAGIGPFR